MTILCAHHAAVVAATIRAVPHLDEDERERLANDLAHQCRDCRPGEAMYVMPSPDNARRTLLIDWLASIGLNAHDIPDNPGALTVTRDSLGALHLRWLEFVTDDDGQLVIDETAQSLVTRAREKSIDVTPPGWDEGAGAWDAHGWVYRLSFPVRHCVTCRCETVNGTATKEDR